MFPMLACECEVATGGYWWWQGEDEPWDPDEHGEQLEEWLLQPADGFYNDPDLETTVVTLTDNALFLRLAEMKPTMQEILEVSDEYGPIFGERGFWWEFDIRCMRFLVELWKSVVAGRRTSFIDRHFKADAAGNVSCPCGELSDAGLQGLPFAQAFHGDTSQAMRRRGKPGKRGLLPDLGSHTFFVGKPLDAAREFLHRAVQYMLELQGIDTVVQWHGDSYEFALRPKSAGSAVWLQFIAAVCEEKEFRACETCGKAFELSPEVGRTSKYHCNDACRVKAYRVRRAKAKQLHAKGKSIAQIAELVGSEPGTIKKWLAAKPRKGK